MHKAVERMEPEILVVDLSLRPSAGQSIICELKSRYPDLKFIVLSLYDERTTVEQILADGAMSYVLKSCVARDLLEAVDAVGRGETYVSPAILENKV